jgi:hypothetical protein
MDVTETGGQVFKVKRVGYLMQTQLKAESSKWRVDVTKQ